MKKRICALILVFSFLMTVGGVAEEAETRYPMIDLDLSQMSGTVVYAQVYNLMYDYESYLGKIIRITGYLDAFEDDVNNIVYTSCIIPDATACCATGIEFVWSGEHAYPKDYPELGSDLIVTGRLESYMEGEYMYLHLADAEVVWLTGSDAS